MARPKPLLAPVIKATLPANLLSFILVPTSLIAFGRERNIRGRFGRQSRFCMPEFAGCSPGCRQGAGELERRVRADRIVYPTVRQTILSAPPSKLPPNLRFWLNRFP